MLIDNDLSPTDIGHNGLNGLSKFVADLNDIVYIDSFPASIRQAAIPLSREIFTNNRHFIPNINEDIC